MLLLVSVLLVLIAVSSDSLQCAIKLFWGLVRWTIGSEKSLKQGFTIHVIYLYSVFPITPLGVWCASICMCRYFFNCTICEENSNNKTTMQLFRRRNKRLANSNDFGWLSYFGIITDTELRPYILINALTPEGAKSLSFSPFMSGTPLFPHFLNRTRSGLCAYLFNLDRIDCSQRSNYHNYTCFSGNPRVRVWFIKFYLPDRFNCRDAR